MPTGQCLQLYEYYVPTLNYLYYYISIGIFSVEIFGKHCSVDVKWPSTFLIYYKDAIEISTRLFNFLIYLLCLENKTEDMFYQLFFIISRYRRYHHGGTTTNARKTRPLLNSCTNYEYNLLIFDFDKNNSSSQLMI